MDLFYVLADALFSNSTDITREILAVVVKILLDDRFASSENDPFDCQLTVQLINTFTNITNFSDEIQIEIMKILLAATCSLNCQLHGEELKKAAQVIDIIQKRTDNDRELESTATVDLSNINVSSDDDKATVQQDENPEPTQNGSAVASADSVTPIGTESTKFDENKHEITSDSCDAENNNNSVRDLDATILSENKEIQEQSQSSNEIQVNDSDENSCKSPSAESLNTVEGENEIVNTTGDSDHETIVEIKIADKESQDVNTTSSDTDEIIVQEEISVLKEEEDETNPSNNVNEPDDNSCPSESQNDNEGEIGESSNLGISENSDEISHAISTDDSEILKYEKESDDVDQKKIPDDNVDTDYNSADAITDKSTESTDAKVTSNDKSISFTAESEQTDVKPNNEATASTPATPLPKKGKKTVSFDDEVAGAAAANTDKVHNGINISILKSTGSNHTRAAQEAKFSSFASNQQAKTNDYNDTLSDSIHVILRTSPTVLENYKSFVNVVWQRLSPALICVLGLTPQSFGLKSSQQTMYIYNNRTCYKIVEELLKHTRSIPSLRPVLESIFYHMLAFPPPNQRLEQLKALKSLFASPTRLLDITLPVLQQYRNNSITDIKEDKAILGLLKLCLQSAVEASESGDLASLQTSIECVCALLESTEELSKGSLMSESLLQYMEKTLSHLSSSKAIPIKSNESEIAQKLKAVAAESQHTPQDKEKEENLAAEKSKVAKLDMEPHSITDIAKENNEVKSEASEQQFNVETNEEKISESDQEDITDKNIDEQNIEIDESLQEEDVIATSDNANLADHPSEDNNPSTNSEIQPISAIGEEERDAIVKQLSGKYLESESNSPLTQIMSPSMEINEKESVQKFLSCLMEILPHILRLDSLTDVDTMLQQFSSSICSILSSPKGKQQQSFPNQIIRDDDDENSSLCSEKRSSKRQANDLTPSYADNIYLATYSVLSLCWKLDMSGYYRSLKLNQERTPIVSEAEFIKSTEENNNAIPQLPTSWLSELYHRILSFNILETAGYDKSFGNPHLIRLIKEDSVERRLKQLKTLEDDRLILFELGRKLARSILTTVWDHIMQILIAPLTVPKPITAKTMVSMVLSNYKEHHLKERQLLTLSLEEISRAARLSCFLGMPENFASVASKLVDATCEAFSGSGGWKNKIFSTSTNHSSFKLWTSQVLGIDTVISLAFELGTFSYESWNHIFRCSAFVAQLDNLYSTSLSNISLSNSSDIDGSMTFTATDDSSDGKSTKELIQQIENQHGISSQGLNWNDAAKIVKSIMMSIERLFEEAAIHLDANGLLSFVKTLCQASQQQLFSISGSACTNDGQYLLRCTHISGRPLAHLMKAWYEVAPHFVKAACHYDSRISLVAVQCIQQFIGEILQQREEMLYFSFNESLFRSFESILSINSSNNLLQERIIHAIRELTEMYVTNVRSGWKPVFSTLRSVRIFDEQHDGYLMIKTSDQQSSPVFEIIASFFNNEDHCIYANAAVECTLCLIKFLVCDTKEKLGFDACEPALKYIKLCCKKLRSAYLLTSRPVFTGADSIILPNDPSSANPSDSIYTTQDFLQKIFSDDGAAITDIAIVNLPASYTILKTDDTGILRVWYLLLEGLTSAVVTCPRKYQPQSLELLFNLFKDITSVPGPHFGIFAITHLLLPMIHAWMRHGLNQRQYWRECEGNFKHACGLATDLVEDQITKFLNDKRAAEFVPGLIHQMINLLTDCMAQPTEAIARVGCASFRHLLLVVGPIFTEELWNIACKGIRNAVAATLYSTTQMLSSFEPGSSNIHGDHDTVKVLARTDNTRIEQQRIHQLADQVFLTETQLAQGLNTKVMVDSQSTSEDRKSFSFLLIPAQPVHEGTDTNNSQEEIKIPFNSLLVGLLSHQLILEVFECLLLDTLPNSVHIPIKSLATNRRPSTSSDTNEKQNTNQDRKVGLLQYLPVHNLSVLLDCLVSSYTISCEFNSRPAIRFMIQKLAKLPALANLYRQAIRSFTLYVTTLFKIYDDCSYPFSPGKVRRIIKKKIIYGRHIGSGLKSTTSIDEDGQSSMVSDYLPSDDQFNLSNQISAIHSRSDRDPVESTYTSTSTTISASHTTALGRRKLFGCSFSEDRTSIHSGYKGDDEVFSEIKGNHDGEEDEDRDNSYLISIIHRIHNACCQVCASYITLHSSDTTKLPLLDTQLDYLDYVKEISVDDSNLKRLISKYSEEQNESSNQEHRIYRVEDQQSQHSGATTPRKSSGEKFTECDNVAIGAYATLVKTMLRLILGLPDDKFKAILPAVLPAINLLILKVNESSVRQSVYQIICRVTILYGIC
ncbi:uncharacterized protein TRIADDRAFT_56511 [Trichoplax adhaerens]|uniref:Uncharacterized protein n=1 Tax=Trichoplax adhaerens TaxID=10228 RepID=B3RYC6_TRIAD|nr:hypothetical protein TRIADDRAFT_56511 [Trichoplax adhaerens]EDV24575.1 hypothetical protein TRIADDRAFT_56511 [Trichoplax adhaerens]|eukprot:XP_002112465.1 hypothetical protein TRIADDRAFT_56511 [Trichoplax adhaerens]